MEIIKIYEAYKQLNKQYAQMVEILTNEEEIIQDNKVLEKLQGFKGEFENLMNQASTMDMEEATEENMKDLKYLLADSYFLALDVCHFYTHNEMGRLKLRVLNYLNKKRRNEMFGEAR